jgi:soluble lytic murein transglycosylase-like protein
VKTAGGFFQIRVKVSDVGLGRVLKLHLILGAGLVPLLVPTAGVGDPLTLSTKSRATLMDTQFQLLDQRSSAKFSNAIGLQAPRAIVPGTPAAIALAGGYTGPYLELARAAAVRNGVPEHLFLRLVLQESGWNSGAVSPKGAIGLAQLMPATARALGVEIGDPLQNLAGGARYLRQMFDRFGSWRLALAAYNAGPEAVHKYRGVPPFAETRQYVSVILGG